MPDLSLSQLLPLLAFIVPGAISLRVFRLIEPSRDADLKDNVLEALVFGSANFLILYPIIMFAGSSDSLEARPWASWFILLDCFFILPIFWPFVLVSVLNRLEALKFIQPRARTAWDHYFASLKQGSYIVLQLNDDSYVGGKYDQASYASSFPDPGHLFLEELWEVDSGGNFTGRILHGQGMIFRPGDYKYVRVST